MTKREEYRLLSTSSLLGYGFPEASLRKGLELNPDMIGVDGGTTDPGPHYLGSGECLNSAKDWSLRYCLRNQAGIDIRYRSPCNRAA